MLKKIQKALYILFITFQIVVFGFFYTLWEAQRAVRQWLKRRRG